MAGNVMKFPFGRYKDTAICNVPKAYLQWSFTSMQALTDEQRAAIGKVLEQYKSMEKKGKAA